MLQAQHTPNMTGVLLSGEPEDFHELYDALHMIIGDEGDEVEEGPVIRVLGVCYDIRHAIMGNRSAGYREHGLSDENLAYLSIVGPKQNLYVSFETLWPEMLYVVFSLESFISSYKRREKATLWDPNIALTRHFQAKIFKLVEETVTPKQFTSFKKWIEPVVATPIKFVQYIDYLNGKWSEMDFEEREKNFNIYAKRVSQVTVDYERQHKKIIEAAIHYECDPSEIRFPSDFYDHIEW